MFPTTTGKNRIGRTTLNTENSVERGWNMSRAIADERFIFVAATSGTNYLTGELSPNVVEQARQAVANVRHVLEEMGSGLDEVVRYHLIVPDYNDVRKLREVIGEAFADSRAVHGVLCCALPSPELKVEIEVTALRAGGNN